MKKIILSLLIALCLTGCSLTENMDNTPTKKVEAFLNKYQMLDEDVLTDLDGTISTVEDFSDEQRERYKDIVRSNYQKLTYTIKDEIIDGDVAKVEVEIEVVDYTKIVSDANAYLRDNPNKFLVDDQFNQELFNDYKLKKLKEADEKIQYTLIFNLTKVNEEWKINPLTDEIKNKINGIY